VIIGYFAKQRPNVLGQIRINKNEFLAKIEQILINNKRRVIKTGLDLFFEKEQNKKRNKPQSFLLQVSIKCILFWTKKMLLPTKLN